MSVDTALIRLIGSSPFEEFADWLRKEQAEIVRDLISSSDPSDLLRLQGELRRQKKIIDKIEAAATARPERIPGLRV